MLNCKDFFLIIIIKTDRAAQTVRSRELILGQIEVVLLVTWIQMLAPIVLIGGATVQRTKMSDLFGRSSYTVCRRWNQITAEIFSGQ